MKAILDDCGDPLGFGETVEEAKADAVKTILGSRAETEEFVRSAINGMGVADFSSALAAQFQNGNDATMHFIPGSRRSFETKEEHLERKLREGKP